jgi:calcium-dependent protein kinase
MKKNENQGVAFSKTNFLLRGKGLFNFKYLKIQELGSGGFSKVFRVQNLITSEIFACKELPISKIKDKEKFKNEVNIMSKCDHPNIIKLVEIYEDRRYVELVMEECCGGTLFDRLLKKMEDDDEAFSEKEAAIIFKQIISAIFYCHNQGIAHRDLKMENVLFLYKSEDSPIKVIDFGLSESAPHLQTDLMEIISGEKNVNMTMSGSVGTPHYISPEVLEGQYNQKCDIWSAGVILYTMLSGSFPFDGDTDKDIYKAILKRKYDFKKEEWNIISDECKDLISHMLCDEGKRYTAEMVLNHPWITKMAPNSKGAISKLNVKHLENYKNISNFKKLILTYVATRLKEKEIKELKEMFSELDINKDGILSFDEIKNCLLKLYSEKNIDPNEIISLFKGIDTNKSRRIEYTEFISAAIEKNEFLKEEKLLDLFKVLDKDKSGKISKSDIKKVLNNEDIDENELNQFILKFDLNGDGEIDYDEFIANMKEIDKDS